MKAVILAGGFGTRLSEETQDKPKPMVEIGGKTILWHIMKIYSAHGIQEFIICCGYKGYVIKEYFANYFLHMSDVTFDLKNNKVKIHNTFSEPWSVTLVDTGEKTMTGGRIKRVREYINKETFCLTYGDGVGDVNITELIEFHHQQGKHATVTVTRPVGRFGILRIDKDQVTSFMEKPEGEGNWVNSGFFVLEPEVLDYIEGDETIWERDPLEKLSADGQLTAYKHKGFWKPMDTLRDKQYLEEHWSKNKAPWKVW